MSGSSFRSPRRDRARASEPSLTSRTGLGLLDFHLKGQPILVVFLDLLHLKGGGEFHELPGRLFVAVALGKLHAEVLENTLKVQRQQILAGHRQQPQRHLRIVDFLFHFSLFVYCHKDFLLAYVYTCTS